MVEGFTVAEGAQRRKASQHAERWIRRCRPTALAPVMLMIQLAVTDVHNFLNEGHSIFFFSLFVLFLQGRV